MFFVFCSRIKMRRTYLVLRFLWSIFSSALVSLLWVVVLVVLNDTDRAKPKIK